LPASALHGLGSRPFGLYLHVPYCTSRCGYCDFNTYTLRELGTDPGAAPASWADGALAELVLARRVLGQEAPAVATVFIGGGTPSVLPPTEIGRVLDGLRAIFGTTEDAEVTIEANPDSTSPAAFAAWRAAGVTRVSLGMQSAAPHVLATLDRTHTPGRPVQAAREARAAGFEHVSLDLIYGTPGERPEDWRHSLDVALGAGPDHLSAYALIVEDGTRLASDVTRGRLPAPDPDAAADAYELADAVLAAAGFTWYEVSNWATQPTARCRHNLGYWAGADWWGVGPGAHSHVGGTRWWNVKHPAAWAARLAARQSPAQAREVLGPTERHVERVMLTVRTRDGLAPAELDARAQAEAARLVDEGLLTPVGDRVRLTLRGRLLADLVARRVLWPDGDSG
jgi:oxygen-independent coproporphyrinogen-3 oxidase